MPSPSQPPPRRSLESFASRDFRRYQLARVMVILGAEAQAVAVAWQVYSLTHRPLDLGYTGLALFLPGLLLRLVARNARRLAVLEHDEQVNAANGERNDKGNEDLLPEAHGMAPEAR